MRLGETMALPEREGEGVALAEDEGELLIASSLCVVLRLGLALAELASGPELALHGRDLPLGAFLLPEQRLLGRGAAAPRVWGGAPREASRAAP